MNVIIHLPFFIVTLVAHVTIINTNCYKEHPFLFWLSICASILLSVFFILAVIKLWGLFCDLIDYYFLQINGGNTGGGNSGSGTGPGSGPNSGPGSGPGKEPGKEPREKTLKEDIIDIMDEEIDKWKKRDKSKKK